MNSQQELKALRPSLVGSGNSKPSGRNQKQIRRDHPYGWKGSDSWSPSPVRVLGQATFAIFMEIIQTAQESTAARLSGHWTAGATAPEAKNTLPRRQWDIMWIAVKWCRQADIETYYKTVWHTERAENRAQRIILPAGALLLDQIYFVHVLEYYLPLCTSILFIYSIKAGQHGSLTSLLLFPFGPSVSEVQLEMFRIRNNSM